MEFSSARCLRGLFIVLRNYSHPSLLQSYNKKKTNQITEIQYLEEGYRLYFKLEYLIQPHIRLFGAGKHMYSKALETILLVGEVDFGDSTSS
jgi:hypothetical protein